MARILKNPIFIYGVSLALLALALRSLEYFFWVRTISTEWYIAILALGFTVLGIWMGSKIVGQKRNKVFEINHDAIRTLGISPREMDVLRQMAKGKSNEEISEALHISISTVKTHVSNLLVKLESDNRVKAINRAKSLQIIEK